MRTSSWSSKNSKEMSVVVRKVILASATLFQKKHRSLSKAPMLSELLGLLKLPLDSLFPLFTQYKGKPSSSEASFVEDGCCPFKIVFDEDLYVVFDEDIYVLSMYLCFALSMS